MRILSPNFFHFMHQDPTPSKKPISVEALSKRFSEARQKQLREQGLVTDEDLRRLEASRKHLLSGNSPFKRA